MKHLAGKQQLPTIFAVPDAVADNRPAHAGRELRDEIAYLIGMRHQDKLRLLRREKLLQCSGECIWSVRIEGSRFEIVNLTNFLPSNLVRDRTDATSNHCRFQSPSGFSGNRLSGNKRLPGDAVELPFALFDDH